MKLDAGSRETDHNREHVRHHPDIRRAVFRLDPLNPVPKRLGPSACANTLLRSALNSRLLN